MREKRKAAKVKTSELCCIVSFYKVPRDYLSFFLFLTFFFTNIVFRIVHLFYSLLLGSSFTVICVFLVFVLLCFVNKDLLTTFFLSC